MTAPTSIPCPMCGRMNALTAVTCTTCSYEFLSPEEAEQQKESTVRRLVGRLSGRAA